MRKRGKIEFKNWESGYLGMEKALYSFNKEDTSIQCSFIRIQYRFSIFSSFFFSLLFLLSKKYIKRLSDIFPIFFQTNTNTNLTKPLAFFLYMRGWGCLAPCEKQGFWQNQLASCPQLVKTIFFLAPLHVHFGTFVVETKRSKLK